MIAHGLRIPSEASIQKIFSNILTMNLTAGIPEEAVGWMVGSWWFTPHVPGFALGHFFFTKVPLGKCFKKNVPKVLEQVLVFCFMSSMVPIMYVRCRKSIRAR